MDHDDPAALGACEHPPEPASVALDDAASALSSAGNLVVGRRRVGPRAVLLEGSSLVTAVERGVQFRDDEPWHIASGERQVGGLARAFELARDAQVDRIAGDGAAERVRLLGTFWR